MLAWRTRSWSSPCKHGSNDTMLFLAVIPTEREQELVDHAFRHLGAGPGAVFGSQAVGHDQGAKQFIVDGQKGGVIFVHSLVFRGVMPVMEFRGGDEPADARKPEAHIGVDKDGMEGHEHQVGIHR